MRTTNGRRATTARILGALLVAVTLAVSACGSTTSPITTTPTCSASQGPNCLWDVNQALFPISTGASDQSVETGINILFLPDQEYGDTTQSANFDQFWNDAVDLVLKGFYYNDVVASNMSIFHFWISPMTVTPFTLPSDENAECLWDEHSFPYQPTWADSIIVVHKGACRDFTEGKFSSVQKEMYGVAVHEFAHSSQAFNLPDEYASDGGYQTAPPEMYVSATGDLCNNDADNSAWRPAAGCSSWKPDNTVENCNGCLVWDSEDTSHTLMATYSPDVPLQFGRANWALIQPVLAKVAPSGTPVFAPTVFSPNDWTPAIAP